jgi:leucyl aminopeptidase
MIRVSRKQVKAKPRSPLLPPPLSFRTLQLPGRITRKGLDDLDHVIVVAPRDLRPGFWRLVPGLDAVRLTHRRLGREARGRALRGQAGPGTAITLGQLPDAEPSPYALLKFAGDLVADALAAEPRSIGVAVPDSNPAEAERIARAVLLALAARACRGPSFRREQKPAFLRSVTVLGLHATVPLDRTLVEAEASNLVRWLTALPPNRLTARGYRDLLVELARDHGWQLEWLDETRLRQAGCGAFLAVAQGNAHRDAGIAHLRYRPGVRTARPALALVGKGILFDTGGTNLKDAKHMLDMHVDMSGSAVALATLVALTRLGHAEPVDCWLAITENRTGSSAYKQRDVLTASNGTTIEVMHTDAEGRLVLADTLALAGKSQPPLVIDYATLTGACIYALSERYSGVFTNRPALHELLVAAGRASGERVWPFPMDDDFDDDLKSQVADTLQCTLGGEADHIYAARFLQRFVPKASSWIHVDLAAVLRKDGLGQMPGGPTGFGVRLSLALLLDQHAQLAAVVPALARGEP